MADRYQLWLCANILTQNQKRRLLTHFASAKEAYEAPLEEWKAIPGLAEESLKAAAFSRNECRMQEVEQKLAYLKAVFLWHEDAGFPERLREIDDAPFGIFLQGQLPPEQTPSIAVIGARACTAYGENIALHFAEGLAAAGMHVISGLAAGIDACAHEGALSVGGMTTGILGSGIGVVYPNENCSLYRSMLERGGIISEYPPDTPPRKHHFPHRNRLISGMADGVLVIEARERSGTLITVDRALEQGRDVYAIPGRIHDVNSRGCINLIKQGARLVTDPVEIVEEYSWKFPKQIIYQEEDAQLCFFGKRQMEGNKNRENTRKEPGEDKKNQKKYDLPLESREKIVYASLRLDPKHFDVLVSECGIPPHELAGILIRMEAKGWVRQPAQNYYIATY